MPTPKFTPGAQLIPLAFSRASFNGLSTELSGNILGQEWATKLENAVFDATGRPAARKGWGSITTTPGSGIVMRVFEYYKADGTSDIIFSTDANIYRDTTTPSAIEGSLTISDGNIKFANFNDKCIAFGIGTGGIPAVKTTGNFADITVNSGTAPTGTIGMAAYGRLWAFDTDGKTLRVSALLDETRWATADDGFSVDFGKVWPEGQDSAVAIEALSGDVVVFGKHSTVILSDGQASSIGIDPTTLYVSDTIPGLGAVSQFAITKALGDLIVLTPFGIVSLKREIQFKSTPLTNLSQHVQSGVVGATQAMADVNDITLTYSPQDSLLLAIFPDADTVYAFDTRMPMQDGTFRATSWSTTLQTATYSRYDENFRGSLTGTVGEVMSYTGHNDDGTEFYFDYESGWLDLGEQMNSYLKFVKRLTSFVFITQNTTVTHKVYYDFANDTYTLDKSAIAAGIAEYGPQVTNGNTAEYSADNSYEYGGGVTLRTLDASLGGGGQYIKIGVRLNTNSGNFVLQQINLYAKVGRLAS